jgi:hypothetical protein
MNSPTTIEPRTPAKTRRMLTLGAAAVVLALAAVIGLTFLVGLSSGPATVAAITFENPTPFALDIEVSAGPGTGWTSAGFVRQRSTAVVEEIGDQGDVWVFRFDSQGQTGGELRFTRSELEAAGWRIVVPDDVARRLADAGAPPTP